MNAVSPSLDLAPALVVLPGPRAGIADGAGVRMARPPEARELFESGPVLVNLVILPLTFISNIWFPTNSLPTVLQKIASFFPIKALADSLQYVFDPRQHGAGLNGGDIRTLVVWSVIGILLMLSFLRQPQGEVV